jgi:cytochrome c peroxidase
MGMKRLTACCVFGILVTSAVAQEGIVDLTDLANYANQPIPAYITRDNTPGNNPITDIGATLGRVLFYDKRLSKNDTVSCSSCHQQEHAFTDQDIASTGVAGTTGRHSMRLINPRFSSERKFFWDERATSVEDQSTKPIQDHVEMGFSGADGDPTLANLITKLSAIEEYQVLFTGVYGSPVITEQRMQRALAQFVRSIQSFDSKYDTGRATAVSDAAAFSNFTAEENAGKQLFLAPPGGPGGGGVGCAGCHRAPEFDIDPNSGNNGVVGSLGGGMDFTNTRSPSLRDLVDASGSPHTGFMHDASLSTLLDVVNHYNTIPAVVTGLDPRLQRPPGQPQRLNLSQPEKDSLVAFLNTLTGVSVYTDTKWSDPFNIINALSLIVLPLDTDALSFSGVGVAREVTVTSVGVPNVAYIFQTSTDMITWTSTASTASVAGELTMTVSAPESDPQCFYRYAYIPVE